MTPRELFLAECRRYLGTKEEPVGSNRGLRIDYWLDFVESPVGSAWCAAFITVMGVQAVGRSAWPFRRSGSVPAIVDDAEKRGLVTRDLTLFVPGDLVVLYYPSLKRFGHIAAGEAPMPNGITCLEGNTNAAGSREGYLAARKPRLASPNMALIRWPEAA